MPKKSARALDSDVRTYLSDPGWISPSPPEGAHRDDEPLRKGDRLDNLGQVWRVLRVVPRRNRIVMAREVPDPRDRFEKVTLADERELHPRDVAHMRRLARSS